VSSCFRYLNEPQPHGRNEQIASATLRTDGLTQHKSCGTAAAAVNGCLMFFSSFFFKYLKTVDEELG
jgi:hypothetical protein